MPFAVFRADASRDLGAGHVMRCLTLAKALASQSLWRCAFVCNPDAVEAVPRLASAGYEMRTVAEADAADPAPLGAWFDRADLLVVDHYRLDAAFEVACRSWARSVMVVDDLADRRHDADLLLDQTLGREAGAYRPLVPPTCRMLLGSAYALLRPEFGLARSAALRSRADRGAPSRLLVSLGATDPENVTSLVVDAVAASGLRLALDVIVGPSNVHRGSLTDRLRGRGTLHVDPPVARIVELLSAADLAIGAGGISAYERCCLGVPTLLVVMADNQKPNAEALSRAGAAVPVTLGASGEMEAISEHLLALVRRPEALRETSAAAARVCDGKGAQRVEEAVSRTIK